MGIRTQARLSIHDYKAKQPALLHSPTFSTERALTKPLSELLTEDKALIFRITHRDNLPHLLHNGVRCRNSQIIDRNFVEIGNPEIIDKRQARHVGCRPGGTLSDYVPFYFTPCSPMLYNIVTGYKGLQQRTKSEIVVLVSSLLHLESEGIDYIIADRNATLVSASIEPERSLLPSLPWRNWRERNFSRDPNDPEKIERYMAEALVYRHLPTSALRGIITYDRATQVTVAQAVSDAQLSTGVHVASHWYP